MEFYKFGMTVHPDDVLKQNYGDINAPHKQFTIYRLRMLQVGLKPVITEEQFIKMTANLRRHPRKNC